MKKYTQIVIVLIFFFAVVFLRRQNANAVIPVSSPSNSNTLSQDNSSQNTNNQQSNNTSPAPVSSGNSMPMMQSGKYKNGVYDGSTENAYYGNVQVRVTISGGKLSDVTFLQYPNDNNTSRRINIQAMPMLKSEALQAQSAQVDGVSGASYTSQAFGSSLNAALQKAS